MVELSLQENYKPAGMANLQECGIEQKEVPISGLLGDEQPSFCHINFFYLGLRLQPIPNHFQGIIPGL